MTTQDFSNGFDTLVNSYSRFKDFDKRELLDSVEFNEYEKSLYLTKSQEDLVVALYSGRNPFGYSFEGTEELRRYLAPLVLEKKEEPIENSSGTHIGVNTDSTFFTLPSDVWYITYEAVNTTGDKPCDNKTGMMVVPVTQDEYHVLKKNPFRGPNSRRALRLDLADGVVEIVCKYKVSSYYIRYLRKPAPIILENLPDGLTIEGKKEGKNEESPCELHEALHQKILENAVVMALQSKGYNINKDNKDNN